MLDRTQQRILGVLIEKELSVPESYPLTENSLLLGCNQKNNRDPEMSLEAFELSGAVMAMRLEGWVVKIEGGRADRYRHEVERKLGLDPAGKAVLAELLLRGPQAPGALKPRVARMGLIATPEQIEAVLLALRDRASGALVELQPMRPRERDQRWAHLLGPCEASEPSETAAAGAAVLQQRAPAAPPPAAFGLEARVARLEAEVHALRAELDRLRPRLEGSGTSS